MIHLTLQGHAEKYAPSHNIPGNFDLRALLYHQLRTYEALEHHSLVMNTYPTGTGKTIAALLWLLHPSVRTNARAKVLLVAPTNALVDQHANDVEEFARQHSLDIAVFRLNARLIDRLESDVHLRRGERLQRFLENPWTFYQELDLAADAERKPYVIVTNPDIFYLALYFQYRSLDSRNVFSQFFLGNFQYVVTHSAISSPA